MPLPEVSDCQGQVCSMAHGESVTLGSGLFRKLIAVLRPRTRPKSISMAVDLPEPDSVSDGQVVVQGWAFSRDGGSLAVSARLDDKAAVDLTWGLKRPDVARAFSRPDVDRCGFEGVVRAGVTSRSASELVVRA